MTGTAVLAILVLMMVSVPVKASSASQPSTTIDISMIKQGVDASRQEVQAALADPAAAFEAYLSKFATTSALMGHPTPGGVLDTKSKAERLQVFKDNLRRAARLNTANSHKLLAYGITPFMHLTQAEFELKYLGQVAPSAAAAEAEAEAAAAAAAEAEAEEEEAAAAAAVAEAKAAAEAAVAAEEWEPVNVVYHRKLLSAMQAPSQPQLAAGAGVELTDQQLRSNNSDVELPQPPAAVPGHSPPDLPPAQRLPATSPAAPQPAEQSPPAGMPTLPMDPSPDAAGCTAQRDYPHDGVVPPADGVNWVAAGRTTAIKDQGLCGSCVAFATAALAEFMHMHKYNTTNTTTDLSEQDMLDCTEGNGCEGQFQTAYVNLIGCSGVALEQDSPYRVADVGDTCKPAQRYSAMSHGGGGGWAYVNASVDSIAQALATAPVMVTLDAMHWALYKGGVLDCAAPGTATNHAVTLVGYFNKVQMPSGQLMDLFLIRNSFGGWWGSGNGDYAGHIFLQKDCTAPGPSGLMAVEGIVPLYG